MMISAILLLVRLLFLAGGVLSLWNPVVILYLFAATPALEISLGGLLGAEYLVLIQAGSLNIFVYDYLMFILSLIVINYIFIKKKSIKPIMKSPLTKAILLLFFWEIFLGILSFSKGFSFQNVLRYIATDALMFLAICIPLIEEIDKKEKKFFSFGVLIGILFACYGICQMFIFGNVIHTSSGTLRAFSQDSVIVMLFPLTYILFSDFLYERKIVSIFAIILLLMGFLIAGFRSGFLVLVIVFSFRVFGFRRITPQNLWIPIWGLVLFAFIFFIYPFYYFPQSANSTSFLNGSIIRYKDIFNSDNSTTQGRLSNWKFALTVLRDKPLIGFGQYPVYSAYANQKNVAVFSTMVRSSHNFIFDKIIHEGLMGLTILMILLYVILTHIKNLFYDDKLKYVHFVSIYILSFLLFSLLNTSFYTPKGRTLLFICVGFLNLAAIRSKLGTEATEISNKNQSP